MMEKVIDFLKKVDYQRGSWWTAIISDILYFVSAVRSVVRYCKTDFGGMHRPDLMDYIFEQQQTVWTFILGYVLLMLAIVFLYISYVMHHQKSLKITMLVCGGFLVFWGISIVLGMLIEINTLKNLIEVFQYVLFIPAGIAGIISIILFLVDEKCRITILLLLGSVFVHLMGVMLVIVILTFFVLRGLFGIFLPERSGRILEMKDEYGNVLERWHLDE